MWLHTILCSVIFALSKAIVYDVISGKPVSLLKQDEMMRVGLMDFCVRDVKPCNATERRRVDGTCNNLKYPQRGGDFTPFLRLMPPNFGADYGPRPSTSGEPLPNARAVRVAVMSDGRTPSTNNKDRPQYTQLLTHAVVYMVGDFSAIQDTINYVVFTRYCCEPGGQLDPRCAPIMVPENDLHLRRSNVKCLNLTTPITYQDLGCMPRTLPPERISIVPIMLDLSGLYGDNEDSLRRYRTGFGGQFRTDIVDGKEWPQSGSIVCINNKLPFETRCHDTANPGTNSILGASIWTIWLLRNHNQIARELQKVNPCWDDEELFMTARDIHIAMWQKIIYYEIMSTAMGRDYLLNNQIIYDTDGYVNDYNKYIEPRLSLEFDHSFRWFHTMQEGRLRLYTTEGKFLDEMSIVDLTFRTGALPLNKTMAGLTQGAFRQPSGGNDDVADPDVGERILGPLQFASDVLSSDLMKGRLLGLQPYNQYRALCGMKKAHDFDGLLDTINREQVDALKLHYESVDDVDVYAAMLAERPLPDSSMGPTIACVMSEQMYRWRVSDRFWFENNQHPYSLTPAQLQQVRIFSSARLLCDHGDDVTEIQPNPYVMPGPGNEIRPCSEIPTPNYEAWRDNKCEVIRKSENMFVPNK